MILFRLLFLPFKLAFGLVGFVLRLGLFLGKLPFKVSAFGARMVGFRGWLFLAVGAAAAALLTPESGEKMRARLQELAKGSRDSDADLTDKVSFELAHAPRTWHLTQPEVSVVSGRVTLRGTAPTDEARDELGRVAAGVPGIDGVDNLVVVAAASATA